MWDVKVKCKVPADKNDDDDVKQFFQKIAHNDFYTWWDTNHAPGDVRHLGGESIIIPVTSGDDERQGRDKCSEKKGDHSTTWEQEMNEESQVVVTGEYVREWRKEKEMQENKKEDHGKEEDECLGEERKEKNAKEEEMSEERSTREEEMREERSTREEEEQKEDIDNVDHDEGEDMSPAQKYPRMSFCWNCGVKLQKDANSVVMKFCWNCGVRLLQIFH